MTLSSLTISPNGQGTAFSTELGATFLDNKGPAHGIELSMSSESFDPTVKAEGLDFIVVKASDGRQVDPKLEEFLNLIQAVPMRGAMHFYQPDQPWQEQADLFLSLVKDKGFHFFVLNLELNPKDGSTAFLADAAQRMNYVQERVQEKVLLQTSSFFITSFGTTGDWMKQWPLFVINNPAEPDPNGSPLLPQGVNEWKLWQYTNRSEGPTYGVRGINIPLVVYNGTPQEMWTWLELPDFAIYDQASDQLIRPSRAIRITGPNGIVYSPNSLYVAAAGENAVMLLGATSGEEITSLSLSGRKARSLSFTPNGHQLAIGTEDGTILIWDLKLLYKDTEIRSIVDVACSQVNRSFTDAEWHQYIGDLPQSITCPKLGQ